jgi:hypothetical protein
MLMVRVGKQLYEAKGPNQNWHSDSHLTLFQGMVRKGDNVAVDNNDDAMRTTVPHN